MTAATIVHFALSFAYGVFFALIAPARMGAALLAGAFLGAALYAANLYGFTAIFPWFVVARDGITLAAHVVFGITVAASYRLLPYGSGRTNKRTLL